MLVKLFQSQQKNSTFPCRCILLLARKNSRIHQAVFSTVSTDDEGKSEEELRRERMQKQFFSGALSSSSENEEQTETAAKDDSEEEDERLEPEPRPETTPPVAPKPEPPKEKEEEELEWVTDKKHHSKLVSFLLLLLNLLVIAAVVVLIRTFVVSPFAVVGHSMDENFTDGELILVDKLSYRLSGPQRGDVVVFHPPVDSHTVENGWLCTLKKAMTNPLPFDFGDVCRSQQYYVKRVIGIPGDKVRIQNGKVYITPQDGEELRVRTDFLTEDNRDTTCFAQNCNSELDIRGSIVDVQEDTVYVLGDNRTGSSDSRAWKIAGVPAPFVSNDQIAGKVRAVFYPITGIRGVSGLDILEKPKRGLLNN